MSAESRVSSEQKLCKKCEISRHFFHFLLNMRKLKNCKSVFFAKFHKNLFHKKNAKFSRNQIELIEKFRQLVNKTSVQKKYFIQH